MICDGLGMHETLEVLESCFAIVSSSVACHLIRHTYFSPTTSPFLPRSERLIYRDNVEFLKTRRRKCDRKAEFHVSV
jgi:hypothetical protein